ncbi:mammalian cell entry protein [Mycolicibacter heraklionensis]|nr:mammalian cell entry protein [Mycolicibacter heraklionensis]
MTDESSGADEVESVADEGAEQPDDVESVADEVASEADAAKPPRRKIGVRLAVAVSAAAFVGAAGFAAAAAQPYLLDRAEVAIKLDIARTAARAIHTLWNYTPENMDTLPDRASVYLSGDLEAQYRKFIDAIADSNKQAKVTDTTEIVGAAVETLDGPEATVIVYTNTTATSELSKSIPQIKYLTYRLHMKRDHNRWVVTRMPTITSLDLTPRLQG